MKIDTAELAERLNNEDVHSIAKSMDITVLALAVICKERNIPWPGARTRESGARAHGGTTSARASTKPSREKPDVPFTPPQEIPTPVASTGLYWSSLSVTLSRRQLYELIWTFPMLQIAKAWGLSDVGLAKICKKHNVPRPGLGYWAKLQNGYKVKRMPLFRPEVETKIEIRCSPVRGPLPVDERQVEEARKLKEQESQAKKIIVPDVLASPHPVTERTLRSLHSAKPDYKGLARPKAAETFSLVCSKGGADRAARIMDALINALEARGLKLQFRSTDVEIRRQQHVKERNEWGVRWRWVTDQETVKASISYIEILGEEISIRLEEDTDCRPYDEKEFKHGGWPHPEWFYTPNGNLTIVLSAGPGGDVTRSWHDSRTRLVEGCLGAVIRGLSDIAVAVRAKRLERERQQREWEEQRRHAAEQQRQREEEAARQKQIWTDIEDLSRARRIREFLAAIRDRALKDQSDIAPGSETELFLQWGERLAQAYDPLRNGVPAFTGYGSALIKHQALV